ncbi:MAG: 50S ribosomal protein L5 [Labilithrix sp.]|nr:50S ribosomal protein L5 [Labilithrix sp.]MCW5817609.1 50S ribosomal protein L5 [Labilithrix sp.]
MADEKKPKGEKKGKGKEQRGGSQAVIAPANTSNTQAIAARFATKYRDEAVPALQKQFNYTNPMEVPRLEKIVVNMGLGQAVTNPKIIDSGVDELRAVTGQKPVVTRAKKAIASFKLREGIPIGAMVTLRSEKMWEFLDRLISVALPRTRDFRGVSRKAFDGKGNYTLGLKEQIIFPEIDYDRIDVIKGLNISFVTSAKTDEEGRALLQAMGMPFRAA